MEKNNRFPAKLAAPALRALANAKITTLQQLAGYSEKEIAELDGIGTNALLKLKEALNENRLAFKKSKKQLTAMQPSNKEICEAFSNGNFELAYNFLAEDAAWDIIGNKIVKGKPAVVEFCNSTAAYFATVATKFTVSNIIADNNTVAINGTAHFINKENKVTDISSCDVYCFNNGLLKSITSYCIVNNKK